MAKLVLIEVSDICYNELIAGGLLVASDEIVAVAQSPKPDNYCRCGRKPQLSNSVRGARFGWWVCTECKRPFRAHRDGYVTRFVQAFGRNLKGDDADVPAV